MRLGRRAIDLVGQQKVGEDRTGHELHLVPARFGIFSDPQPFALGAVDYRPGLEHLPTLTGLRRLDLSGTPVTDEGLAKLKAISTLDGLILHGAAISDRGAAHLKELRELGYLDLSGTAVSDAGLVHLHGLTNLWQVNFRETRVTPEGMACQRRVLPNCLIRH